MFDRNSKVFFVVLSLGIGFSTAATYYNIVVLKNYRTYTKENAPEATDIYDVAFDFIREELNF